MNLLHFTPLEQILWWVACGLLLVEMLYIVGIYGRISQRAKKVEKGELPLAETCEPLSVVLCARDDAERLRQLLPLLLEQDYPCYEVVVINNASTDDTEDVLKLMAEKYPHLYHSFTPKTARYISQKKLALTLGIKASKYEWVVFTETDSVPATNQWLRRLARHFTPDTDIVLGYSSYQRKKGAFYRLIGWDNFVRSIRYLGLAICRFPYMGMGRNLAYRKKLFFDGKGFSAYLNFQRGEDDLFINRLAHRANTRVELSPQSVVHICSPSAKEWKNEQLSYLTTARHFRGWHRQFWGFDTLATCLLYGVGIALVVLGLNRPDGWLLATLSALLLLVHLIVFLVDHASGCANLGRGTSLRPFPPLALCLSARASNQTIHRTAAAQENRISQTINLPHRVA